MSSEYESNSSTAPEEGVKSFRPPGPTHSDGEQQDSSHLEESESSKREEVQEESIDTVVANDSDRREKIPPDKIPDVNINTGNPLSTDANIAFLLTFYKIHVVYNQISKRMEIYIPGFKGSPDNYDSSALAIVYSLAALNQIPTTNLMAFLGLIADRNSINPIAEWMKSVEWDGVDRITPLTETLQITEEYSPHLRRVLVRRWLLSAAAAVLIVGFHSRGVLTLQGPQGIGKTAWVKMLLPEGLLRDRYIKLDHHLDPGQKDTILTAIAHWIVEIGELDSSLKKDIGRLKGFITAPHDKVRAPYGRTASEFPRRTVFVATVNSDQFLVDDTGNSRWWTIPVTNIDYNHDIDMQQLWAQAAHLVEVEKEQWWLNEHEEALLETHNRQFMRASVVADLLQSRLNWNAPKEQYTSKSATEVLQMIGIDRPSNPQARDCGTELRVRLGAPKKSHGKTRWHVPPLLQHTHIGEDDEF